MTQEEKAKAYDEVIRKAKITLDCCGSTSIVTQHTIYDIFPELKESEGERVKKELIKLLRNLFNNYSYFIKDPFYTECIAWLEKQGNTNETINRDETINRYEFAQDVLKGAAINLITWIDYNAAESNMCLSNMECKDIEDALVNGNWDKIYAYIKKKLEKQGEKPQGKSAFDAINEEKVDNVNKIEPKDYSSIDPYFFKATDKAESRFKVGDWVVFNNKHQSIYQVEKIEDGYYILRHTHGGTFRVCVLHDESLRLWDITKDIKNGDVLADKYNNIGIFQECEGICWHSYIYLGCDGEFRGFSIGGSHEQTDTHPATKEQRDLLFQKMKEAGYEWDEIKNELKEIEQKSVTMSLDEAIEHCKEKSCGNNACALEHKQLEKWLTELKELKEQKPA